MRRWRAAAGSAAVAVLLAGCGAGTTQDPSPVTPSPVVAGSQGRVEHVPPVGSGFGGYGDYAVLLPPGYGQDPQRRYPVVYLLHAGGGDEDFYLDLGVREAMDAALAAGSVGAMILVMVDGGPKFAGDGTVAESFDDWFVSDLVPSVDRTWLTRPLRTGRAIAGISLGGRHALAIAATHPDLAVAVGGHSTTVANLPDGTAQRLAAARIAVYLDVGRSDGLFDSDEALARSLREQGADVRWNPAEGAHEPAYWRGHLLDYLRFYSEELAA